MRFLNRQAARLVAIIGISLALDAGLALSSANADTGATPVVRQESQAPSSEAQATTVEGSPDSA
jgi:hypothetical protein